jgi:DNA mismatch repair protein MutL
MSGLHLFVNGRPVRDPSLARAVAFAYGSVLPPGRYPVGALSLTLPAAEVDVNVHPQKSEVRFAQGRAVYDAVTRVLAAQLGTSAWGGPAARPQSYWEARLGQGPSASGAAGPAPAPASAPPEVGDLRGGDPWGLSGDAARARQLADVIGPPVDTRAGAAPGARPPSPSPAAPAQTSLGLFASLRVLGQVRSMMLICEGPDALYVIDQHAADERVRYHALRQSYAERKVATQRLIFPERLECNEDEVALIESHAEALAAMGLECSALGPTTVAVHAVPALLSRAAPERLLRDVLDELAHAGERAFSDAVDMALATMACHGAIRAGDPLSREQAQALLANMDQVDDFAGHCPHGRPVVHSIPFGELERRLGR